MPIIQQIRKRDGRIVNFDSRRIENAILKASIASKGDLPTDTIYKIAQSVVEETEQKFDSDLPSVEEIQDIVEKKLVERNLFDLAKAYILYRRERQDLREVQSEEKSVGSWMNVKKRDGSLAKFNPRQIENSIIQLSKDLSTSIAIEELIETCLNNAYDGITTAEINQALIMAIRAKIETDPIYAHLASRVLFNDLYKEILQVNSFSLGFETLYKNKFESQLRKGVISGRLDPRLLIFDLDQLSNEIKPNRDDLFRYLGAQTLYDRYFLRSPNDHGDQCILEVPQYFWMRIAMGLALNENDREKRAIEFYEVMSQLLYVPSTPTLFHSGTTHPQMSSCYLTTIEDDLEHIFKSFGDNAQLAKWSGGIGSDWTNIRGTGSMIKSTNVNSQGVIPFLKIVDSTTAAINRSGKRRGATCVYLETWHYDLEDFLELRKNTGDDRRRTHDTNTANWIPDLFMKRVLNDEKWTLFSPNEVPDLHHIYGKNFEDRYVRYERKADQGEIKLWRRVRAVDLWRKMVTQLFETGHPWMTFKDPCNIRSPQDHVGTVHSSNLCTEITLNTSRDETAVCNLGSINVPRHIYDHKLDRELLQITIKTAMRMLDNVIDLNFYPTIEAENSNLKHRPIGLGLMGLQDAFYAMRLRFDSDEAIKFSDQLMETISYHAIMSSSELARERGTYGSYGGSKWARGIFPIDTIELLEKEREMTIEIDRTGHLDWSLVRDHVKEFGMRNSNCMAIAPTATIANISGCFPSIEPAYKNLYTKSNISGEFTIINQYLITDLQRADLWNEKTLDILKYHDGSVQRLPNIDPDLKALYKEVFEIESTWLIKHAAARGKWIDQSQSLNIFTRSLSGREISEIYFEAWKRGLKTTYYLRTLGASAIEKSTIDINTEYVSTHSDSEIAVEDNRFCHLDDDDCEACQ